MALARGGEEEHEAGPVLVELNSGPRQYNLPAKAEAILMLLVLLGLLNHYSSPWNAKSISR